MDEMYSKLPDFMKGSLKVGIGSTPAAKLEEERFAEWVKTAF